MSGDGIPGLAAKLNHLFATVPAPTKSGLYSNDSAAHALEQRGVTVSGVHISHLRSGRRDNPSARLLAALAELFGVPIATSSTRPWRTESTPSWTRSLR